LIGLRLTWPSVALQAANSVTGNLNDAGAAQANSDNL
jgi:hypothetical protein